MKKMDQQGTPNYPIASVYVVDLNPDVTEAMLFEKFSACGPVLSIRVCRELVTKGSLGYAYVNFQQPADAERAIDIMNYDPIKGMPCRIMWSQREPTLRRSEVGKIFINNLDKNIDNKGLYDIFSAFGNILSCKIATVGNSSRGLGFLHYETKEAAQEAIAKVNGMMLNDKKVFVGEFISKRERLEKLGDQTKKFKNVFVENFGDTQQSDSTSEEKRNLCHEASDQVLKEYNDYEIQDEVCRAQKKEERSMELKNRFEAQKMERINRYQGVYLYVKNLEGSIDDEKLRSEFAMYGTITSAKVIKDDKGISKGFGYVCFSTPDEAAEAANETDGRILVTKQLYVGFTKGVNLYIGNLEDAIDDEKLRSEFSSYGAIKIIKVIKNIQGSSGFGFVCFSTPEEATDAVNAINSRIHVTKPLYVAFAKGINVYIDNLEDGIDDEKLWSEFATYGAIISAKVMKDDKGNSKGFGFVYFLSPDEATQAVTEMNGRILVTKPLYVATLK